jgi:enamine deaminase RidA (YjgF/YER057c/UK114 family)
VAATGGPEREAVHVDSFGEQVYGFAQAVRAGNVIHVAGQTAMNADGSIVGGDDMAAQMRAAYQAIEEALAPLGARLSDIVDETLFVTDYMAAATVAREVRGAVYGDRFDVASTLVEVATLGPGMLIEIKCTAQT